MTFNEFMAKVERAARRVGMTDMNELAMMLASAHIESKATRGELPSMLAFLHHNLFGIKWLQGDESKGYYKVTMPANQFEPAGSKVEYRGYDSQEHCILNWIWHRDKSIHYHLFHEQAQTDLERGVGRDTVYATWTLTLGSKWAEGNPNHCDSVVKLYWQYLNKLKGRGS